MHLFGIDWVGVTPDNGRKLRLSVLFIAIVLLLGRGPRALAGLLVSRSDDAGAQTRF